MNDLSKIKVNQSSKTVVITPKSSKSVYGQKGVYKAFEEYMELLGPVANQIRGGKEELDDTTRVKHVSFSQNDSGEVGVQLTAVTTDERYFRPENYTTKLLYLDADNPKNRFPEEGAEIINAMFEDTQKLRDGQFELFEEEEELEGNGKMEEEPEAVAA